MSHTKNIRLGISIGDINGVGPEVIMKTFNDARILDFCTPIIFAPSKVIAYYRKTLQLKNFQFTVVDKISAVKNKHVNVVASTHKEVPLKIGVSTKEAGKIALESLQAATEALKNGDVDVLITAPINKENIQSEEFKFPGHTEYLKDCFESKESLMLMVNDNLKVAVITGHIPLSDVSNTITKELVKSKAKALNQSLKQDFTIRKPKIAILALNPHAGDKGLIGTEENDFIEETIEELQEERILAFGPFPADGFFGSNLYTQYDAVLAMYHDQGLVPFKTLSFRNGVNFTAALPFVRTSPDHGTAYEIAGKNQADSGSFRKAVFQAIDIFRARTSNQDLEENKIDSKEIGQFLNQRRQAYSNKNKNKPNPRRPENKGPRKPEDSKPTERKDSDRRPKRDNASNSENKGSEKSEKRTERRQDSDRRQPKANPRKKENSEEKSSEVPVNNTEVRKENKPKDVSPKENTKKQVNNNLNKIFESLTATPKSERKPKSNDSNNSSDQSKDKTEE